MLSRSLALLEAGEDIDSVVVRFPEAAERLSELLKTAQRLEMTPESAIQVPYEFLRNLGERLRA
jgi:hypothetical protein